MIQDTPSCTSGLGKSAVVAMKDWSRLLSGSNKARVVSSLLRQAVSGSGFSGEGRHAAVLVPLLIANGEPSVLFTIRSTNLSRHRGQVRLVWGVLYRCAAQFKNSLKAFQAALVTRTTRR